MVLPALLLAPDPALVGRRILFDDSKALVKVVNVCGLWKRTSYNQALLYTYTRSEHLVSKLLSEASSRTSRVLPPGNEMEVWYLSSAQPGKSFKSASMDVESSTFP